MPITISQLGRYQRQLAEEQSKKTYFDKLKEWLRWAYFTGQHHSHWTASHNVRFAYLLSGESTDNG